MNSSPATSAIAAFCRDLRDARRFQQISLLEVAETTRITPEFLEALETGRWNEIPPAYLRGYLGLYAQAVGMNRDKVLRAFDQMTIPTPVQSQAILDEGPRILEEPQHAEVTRVKIRTAWFAALSRNRAAIYGLTFLTMAVILGLIYWSRHAQNVRVATISFEQAEQEYRTKVHSPLTVIPLPTDTTDNVSQSGKRWVTCIGVKPGAVVFRRASLAPQTLQFGVYDTINIEYVQEIVLKIHPNQSAVCRVRDSLLLAEYNLPGDTQIFRVGPATAEKTIQPDSLSRP